MGFPWKKIGSKAWEWALLIIRTTAPDKSQADPPPEPTAEELWERWKKPKT